ncbi:MAG TPA: hypothetical protein VN824_15395, partial [Puia sp.]|nr:hypothetical protein [Puia sp.]
MRIRYKLNSGVPDRNGSESHDREMRLFEEILGFKEGFRYVKIPASIGEGTLAALAINNEFHANFQFYRLDVPL